MNKRFITIEGPDGSGKTTMIAHIEKYLISKGMDVLTTREPGGIEIAEKIRGVILDPAHTKMDRITEALLYAASRRQHLVERIIPALEAGKIVICDRFVDSSLAYQGFARGIGIDEVMSINQHAIQGLMPSLTIYLDIRPEIGLSRIKANRNRELDRLDLESLDFHYKAYQGYQEVLRRYPERIVTVNAEQPVEDVFDEIKRILNEHIFH